MKRLLVFLFVLGLICASADDLVAQRFSFSPSNTWDQEYYKDTYSSNQIIITNETTEALAFRWKFITNTFPAEWSFSICDLGSCFPIPPDSNDMNLTIPGGDAYFICHTTYNGFVGSGEIQLFVFEIGDEANGDTVTFRYSTTNVMSTGSLYPIEKELMIFPNPTSDIINLQTFNETEISHITIYDILGQPVIKKRVNEIGVDMGIGVSHLMAGQYFVSVLYRNGERATTVFYKSNQ